jgi:hypothetical protein
MFIKERKIRVPLLIVLGFTDSLWQTRRPVLTTPSKKYNQRLQRSKVCDNLSRREVVIQARLPPFATPWRVSDNSCFGR